MGKVTNKRNSILKRNSPKPTINPSNKRRISFSTRNFVKEFIPGDFPTVLGTSYEETTQSFQVNSTTSGKAKIDSEQSFQNQSHFDKDVQSQCIALGRKNNINELPACGKENIDIGNISSITNSQNYSTFNMTVNNTVDITLNPKEIGIFKFKGKMHTLQQRYASIELIDDELVKMKAYSQRKTNAELLDVSKSQAQNEILLHNSLNNTQSKDEKLPPGISLCNKDIEICRERGSFSISDISELDLYPKNSTTHENKEIKKDKELQPAHDSSCLYDSAEMDLTLPIDMPHHNISSKAQLQKTTYMEDLDYTKNLRNLSINNKNYENECIVYSSPLKNLFDMENQKLDMKSEKVNSRKTIYTADLEYTLNSSSTQENMKNIKSRKTIYTGKLDNTLNCNSLPEDVNSIESRKTIYTGELDYTLNCKSSPKKMNSMESRKTIYTGELDYTLNCNATAEEIKKMKLQKTIYIGDLDYSLSCNATAEKKKNMESRITICTEDLDSNAIVEKFNNVESRKTIYTDDLNYSLSYNSSSEKMNNIKLRKTTFMEDLDHTKNFPEESKTELNTKSRKTTFMEDLDYSINNNDIMKTKNNAESFEIYSDSKLSPNSTRNYVLAQPDIKDSSTNNFFGKNESSPTQVKHSEYTESQIRNINADNFEHCIDDEVTPRKKQTFGKLCETINLSKEVLPKLSCNKIKTNFGVSESNNVNYQNSGIEYFDPRENEISLTCNVSNNLLSCSKNDTSRNEESTKKSERNSLYFIKSQNNCGGSSLSLNTTEALCNWDSNKITSCIKSAQRQYRKNVIEITFNKLSENELALASSSGENIVDSVSLQSLEDSHNYYDTKFARVSSSCESLNNEDNQIYKENLKDNILCKKCDGKVTTNLKENKLNVLLETEDVQEVYSEINRQYERLKNLPTIEDAIAAFKKRRESEIFESSREETVTFPEIPSFDFLLDNYIKEYRYSLQKNMLEYEYPINRGIFPLKPSFMLLFQNKLRCEELSNWQFDDSFFNSGLFDFRHKRTNFLLLQFKFPKPTYTEKLITFDKISLKRCNYFQKLSAMDVITNKEVQEKLPYCLEKECPTSKELFTFLESIDSLINNAIEYVKKFKKTIILTNSSLERDENENCFIQKTIKGYLNDGNLYDVCIRVQHLDALSYKDILLPPITDLKNEIQSLPMGIGFIESFLKSPEIYL